MNKFLLAIGCACLLAVSGYAAKKIVTYEIDQSTCKACEKCISMCPAKAKKVTVNRGKKTVVIDPELCTKDGKCTSEFKCPNEAIKVIETKKRN